MIYIVSKFKNNMNIFGRSQELEAFETKTIAVSATPPLTRIVQNAYIATTLQPDLGSSIGFNTPDISGLGSKTIPALNNGDMIISKFTGFVEMQAGTGASSSFQIWFPYTDGKNTYNEHYSFNENYVSVADYSTGFIDCEWIIQKTNTNQVLMTWNIKVPDPTNFPSFKRQSIISYSTNKRLCTYADGSPITINVLWACNTPDHQIYLYPTHCSINVMRSVALTADYT